MPPVGVIDERPGSLGDEADGEGVAGVDGGRFAIAETAEAGDAVVVAFDFDAVPVDGG